MKVAKNVQKISDENEMLKLLKLIVVVTVIFLAFYILTIFINKKSDNENTNNNNVSIQYEEILIGDLFKQKEENYYVLVKNSKDEYLNAYNMYLSMYKSKEGSITSYNAVLNNAFNAQFLSEQANITNNLEELKFSQTTLVEIKNGQIAKSYEGDNILKHLMEITETKAEEK